jgi:hypothetical protein
MGKTSDLSDFERGMIVLGFSHTQCLGFTENCETKNQIKHPVCGSPVGENSLLMREVEEEWQELCKLAGGPQTGK